MTPSGGGDRSGKGEAGHAELADYEGLSTEDLDCCATSSGNEAHGGEEGDDVLDLRPDVEEPDADRQHAKRHAGGEAAHKLVGVPLYAAKNVHLCGAHVQGLVLGADGAGERCLGDLVCPEKVVGRALPKPQHVVWIEGAAVDKVVRTVQQHDQKDGQGNDIHQQRQPE
eukprot:CAMPEP_0204536936 /NCGR_PEP_ID=MMETSP0661-20131031/14841_1 /ASSEMBLY_ACC=CAM_ASM_000606 /TAXON_ID=109239 /ORGANISM="Alexandrium margalefi, Strain AMGDE01CS-322" /LENGTH=168 /DNA_ID=CAMNT_0051543475 /DNA_START=16 /DNA_END=520 /DNA_ORIENTATION=-